MFRMETHLKNYIDSTFHYNVLTDDIVSKILICINIYNWKLKTALSQYNINKKDWDNRSEINK